VARSATNPKKFIVSCRVNHREMETLQKRAEESGISITTLLRKSLELMDRDGNTASRASA